MGTFIDLTGRRFGMLTVTHQGEGRVNKQGICLKRWWALCDCGNTKLILSTKLCSGSTKSCGCLAIITIKKNFITHGLRHTRAYETWAGMKQRCLNPRSARFRLWGGRGITICDRWVNSFENFFVDMGHPPEGKTIDRIDNDAGYSPENCRWATPKEQANNLSTTRKFLVDGETHTISSLAEKLGTTRPAISLRLRRGATIEQVIAAFT